MRWESRPPRIAHCYDQNYTSSTSRTDTLAAKHLTRGVYHAYPLGKRGAEEIIDWLNRRDQVMYHRSHGNEQGGRVTTATIPIVGKKAFPEENVYDLNRLFSHDLAQCWWVLWKACHTAKTDEDWGNLCDDITGCVSRGARSCSGFKEVITGNAERTTFHTERLYEALTQGKRNPEPDGALPDPRETVYVNDALAYAARCVDLKFGGPGGFQDFQTFGENLRIAPHW